MDSTIVEEADLPFKYYSNPVKISNHEFVVLILSNKQLMKYNTSLKQWSKYFNYDDQIEEKLQDWTKKTNFHNFKHITYKCSNGEKIIVTIIHRTKDKIFVEPYINSKKIDSDKQYKWISLPSDRLSHPLSMPTDENVRLFYNEQNEKFYVHQADNLTILDTKNNIISSCEWHYDYNWNMRPQFICGKFHWIKVGWGHYAFDPETGITEENDTFPVGDMILTKKSFMFHIASRNMLLLIGDDQIWRGKTEDGGKWEKVCEIPNDFKLRGQVIFDMDDNGKMILTNDEQYILQLNTKRNYYLNVDTMKFEKVRGIKKFKHMLMMDDTRDSKEKELTVYGFTRRVWRGRGLKDVMVFPSSDVLGMIVIYCGSEYIHMLNYEKHSKINILDVIPNYGTI